MSESKKFMLSLTMQPIEIPPVSDVLVLAKRHPQGKLGVMESFRFIAPDEFEMVDLPASGANVEAVLIHKRILKKIPLESVLDVLSRHVFPHISPGEAIKVDFDVRLEFRGIEGDVHVIAAKIARDDYVVVDAFRGLASVTEQLIDQRYLVVMDGETYAGILTPSDVLCRPHKLVIDCLEPKPRVDESAGLHEIVVALESHESPVLAVFDGDAFRGVVTWPDVVRAIREVEDGDDVFRILGQLVQGVAHDFNNLLTGVLGHLEIAGALERDDNVRGLVETARTHLLHATQLIRQVQSISSSASPSSVVDDLETFLRDGVVFFLRGTSIRPEFEFDSDVTGARIEAQALSRVIGNLVVNAREAMGGKGNLLVRVTSVTSGGEQQVAVAITDDGPGIPDSVGARVFERNVTTREGTGRGIGLAIVRSIVEACGGRISLRSVPGGGATFEFVLPAA